MRRLLRCGRDVAKARHTITAEDVDRIFNNACVEALARELPAHADGQRFAVGIREAARIYARDSREPTVNELYNEIAKLQRTAERQRYDQLTNLIEGLSTKAR